MRIEVTQRDIDLGIVSSTHRCPLALALTNHFRRSGISPRVYAGVNGFNTQYHNTWEGDYKWSDLNARKFICNFDLGQPVKPGFFDYNKVK